LARNAPGERVMNATTGTTDAIVTIERDHGRLRRLVAAVETMLEEMRAGTGGDIEALVAFAEYTLDYPELHHRPLEDRLQQALLARAPELGAAMAGLQATHESLTRQARALATMANNLADGAEVPRPAVIAQFAEYAAAQLRHMASEEELFLPALRQRLDAETLREIGAEMAERADPLFGAHAGDRYEALRRRVLDVDAAGSLSGGG